MKQFMKLITAFAFGVCAVFSWQLCNEICKEKVIEPQVKARIPTIESVQKLVGAEPDGIIGSETIRLWGLKLCEQEASIYDYYYQEK